MGIRILTLSALGIMCTISLAHADPATECGYQAGSQVEISNCPGESHNQTWMRP
jgi:hypothetical protein